MEPLLPLLDKGILMLAGGITLIVGTLLSALLLRLFWNQVIPQTCNCKALTLKQAFYIMLVEFVVVLQGILVFWIIMAACGKKI